MPVWVCATCANHYPDADTPPPACLICSDERQWVPPAGQRWTTGAELAASGYRTELRDVEPGLLGIGVAPKLGIGQRGLLLQTAEGNLLWDPPGFLDAPAMSAVREAGGLRFVTASHPHFYGAMAEWAELFGAEVLVAEPDLRWLTRDTPAVRTWSGVRPLLPGVHLLQCGGHFPGSGVVHWAHGARGRGVLLSGDTIFVTPGEDRVTFIWSAPNRLPLPEVAVRHVAEVVSGWDFDRVYGGWWEPVLRSGAKAAIESSVPRYLRSLNGELGRYW